MPIKHAGAEISSGQRRFAGYCHRTQIVWGHRAQYEGKPVICLLIQRPRGSRCRRRAVPLYRLAALADDCRTGDEPKLGIRGRQRTAAAQKQVVDHSPAGFFQWQNDLKNTAFDKAVFFTLKNFQAAWKI